MRLPATPRAPRLGRSQLIACFYGVLTASAVLWSSLRGHPNLFFSPPLEGAARASTPLALLAQLVSSVAIGVAFGLIVVWLTRVLQERYLWAKVLHNEFHHLLGALSSKEILLLAAASAIGEESFFRGALLSHLASAIGGAPGIVFAVVGSSLLFGLLHIGPGTQFLPWTLSSLGIGLCLGMLYVATGDLLGPIAAHFVVNLLNLHDIVRRTMPA